MRHHHRGIFTLLSLLAIAAWRLDAADNAGRSGGYRFETEPRAVLAPLGITSSSDPKLALRASGTIYMLAVFGQGSSWQLGLAISHDGGDEFAPPIPISEKGAQVSSHGENSPTLALGQTEFYALWEQNTAKGGTDLMFARSIDFGHSFQPPIRVADKSTPSSNGFSHMTVGPNGYIYAVWLDGRDPPGPPGTQAVYLARSTDRGATFGKNLRISAGACPCCRPTVATGNKGEVFVAWRHVFDGEIRDMVIATSTDKGETFAPPVRVAVDNWKISGCPHSGMTMVTKGNRLYVSWFSEGTPGHAGVRLSWSDDCGKTFVPPEMISGNMLDANHPAMVLSEDEKVLLIFQGREPGKQDGWSPARPYLVAITDEGHVGRAVPVLGNKKGVSYPALAGGSSGRVYIAWTESGGKGRTIVLSRGRRAP